MTNANVTTQGWQALKTAIWEATDKDDLIRRLCDILTQVSQTELPAIETELLNHATRHQDAGDDEINLTGLQGDHILIDETREQTTNNGTIHKNTKGLGGTTGKQHRYNDYKAIAADTLTSMLGDVDTPGYVYQEGKAVLVLAASMYDRWLTEPLINCDFEDVDVSGNLLHWTRVEAAPGF